MCPGKFLDHGRAREFEAFGVPSCPDGGELLGLLSLAHGETTGPTDSVAPGMVSPTDRDGKGRQPWLRAWIGMPIVRCGRGSTRCTASTSDCGPDWTNSRSSSPSCG